MNVTEYFDKHQLKYVNNFSTALLSSIKAGGCARYIVYPDSAEKIISAVEICELFSLKYKVIGGCTNTFFSDAGFDGVIISTKYFKNIEFLESSIVVEAGTSLSKMLNASCERGVDISAQLFGIPGSVGGAVRNNAGAFGASISDTFSYGRFYDTDSKKIFKLDSNDMMFSYRNSVLQNNSLIMLKGVFKCIARESAEIKSLFNVSVQKRRASQPRESSLGSFFKRCGDVIPSRLIDEARLKGMRVGGAEVSRKHAGFIINSNKATASDINELAKQIEKIVFERYGVSLIREAEFVE